VLFERFIKTNHLQDFHCPKAEGIKNPQGFPAERASQSATKLTATQTVQQNLAGLIRDLAGFLKDF
jgi:hypothetical protein